MQCSALVCLLVLTMTCKLKRSFLKFHPAFYLLGMLPTYHFCGILCEERQMRNETFFYFFLRLLRLDTYFLQKLQPAGADFDHQKSLVFVEYERRYFLIVLTSSRFLMRYLKRGKVLWSVGGTLLPFGKYAHAMIVAPTTRHRLPKKTINFPLRRYVTESFESCLCKQYRKKPRQVHVGPSNANKPQQ